MNKKLPIALIGFMGTGKSTIGAELAQKLNYQFIDSDSYIEEKAQKKISDIFAEKGEAYFRDLETRALDELLKKEQMILSTGGGIILREENRTLLKERTFLVSLKASVETIFKRTSQDTSRPLLKDTDPRKRITELLSKRHEFYEIGDLQIDTDQKTVTEICQLIIESYSKQF